MTPIFFLFFMITIKQLTSDTLTDDILEQLLSVLKQLSTSVSEHSIRNAVSSPQNHVLIAWHDDRHCVLGTTTMAFLHCVTGVRVHIEDVVVDHQWRGQGIAQKLINEAIFRAQNQLHARTIDLTSRPDKVEANRLYKKLGFVQRDTNVYRYVTLQKQE